MLQRATRAEVRVDGRVQGRLSAPGLVLLVGITHTDTAAVVDRVADKIWGLRIFSPVDSGVERSASDLGAPILVVSQFTLYASIRKGRRPSWNAAAPREISEPLVAEFVAALRRRGAHVETGTFGAHMQVDLVNDGPVTVVVDSAELGSPD